MVSLLCSVGFMLWAKERLTPGGLVATLRPRPALLGISTITALFATNPWKFGMALPVSILVLGLAQMTKRRWAELLAVAHAFASSPA